MDQERFDRLAVALAAGAPRRTLLRLAGGSLAALLAGRGFGRAASTATKRRKGHGNGQGNGRGKDHSQGHATPQRVGTDAKRCAKQCRTKKSKQARRKCRKRCQPPVPDCTTTADCPAGELCESGVCIPSADQCATTADCDACERCDAGVCVTRCQAGERCQNDQCVAPPQCTADGQCGACERCTGGRCSTRCQPHERCQNGQCVVAGGGCTPTTCQAAGAACGSLPDACGGMLRCGDCTPPATCGGGDPGTPHQCGCTPEDPCGPNSCGELTNNCGESITCSGPLCACEGVRCNGTCCAEQRCQTTACVDGVCTYTSDPDHTACPLPGGGAGICRGGACVVNACTTVADCAGGTANACTDGVCVCGGGPACNLFADEECCGAAPGGACVHVETDPANCGGCGNACPPGVCGVPTCTHQVCGTDPAPDNSNPGRLCGDSEVCCGGVCELIIAPQNCGTCGHVCPTPSLPCQFAVCNNRVCGHENWPDGAPGGSCTTGQCCDGICCTNPFPVCGVAGICQTCTQHSQCPSGHNCCAGHCVEACCPLGNACHRTDQCCSGNCSDVLFGGVCCLGDGADCTSPGECCSVRCIGTCVGHE